MSDKVKKLARELQRLGGGAVTYSTCRRMLLASGYDEARKQIERWLRDGAAELAQIGRAAR